jgi:hypothetical protein
MPSIKYDFMELRGFTFYTMIYRYTYYTKTCVVWCPGQNIRIAP